MAKRLKLKVFRTSLDLSQEEMSRKCNTNRATYCLIEQGKTRGSEEFWYNLKNEFNLSLEDVWNMQYEGRE